MTRRQISRMTRRQISRAAFRHVEAELCAYPETRRELERMRADIIERGMAQALELQVTRAQASGEWFDPTLSRATALVTHLTIQGMERIVRVVEAVYAALPPERQRLIRLRYWERPGMGWQWYAQEIGADESTLRRWRNHVVELIALRMGWR